MDNGSILLIVVLVVVVIFWMLAKDDNEGYYPNTYNPMLPEEKQKTSDIIRELDGQKAIREKELREYLQNEKERFKDCMALEVDVKGIFYRSKAAKEEIPYLNAKDEIKLRKEPTNPYDDFAVKVMYERKHLGYIPKENSELVSNLIDQKRIKRILVTNTGDGKVSYFDEADPFLEITIFYE